MGVLLINSIRMFSANDDYQKSLHYYWRLYLNIFRVSTDFVNGH